MQEPGNPIQRQQAMEIVAQMAAQQTITTGPLPSAQEFEYYEQVLPGAANRILTMAEANQNRRHQSETLNDETNRILAVANAKAVEAGARSSDRASDAATRSQWMAFAITIVFLGCSVGLALLGKEVVASVLGGGVLVTLVTTFLRKPAK
jgi:uncharacterized membrane protein